ncbi:competence protein ComEA [Neisseria sp. HSC-16F19]|nr:ComEA family DNA-binding protein [Neisseria sp. HSC-16F19]MCP2041620.1 competence protein ComEA [Neisseria sp. HSC-16F19]
MIRNTILLIVERKGIAMKKLLLALVAFFSLVSAFAAVNINTADVQELQTLHNIGAKKAEAIVAYRTENGPFKAIEDIQKVKGIGKATFEKLKTEITVGTAEKAAPPKAAQPATKK